jgi:hypothetical protein
MWRSMKPSGQFHALPPLSVGLEHLVLAKEETTWDRAGLDTLENYVSVNQTAISR